MNNKADLTEAVSSRILEEGMTMMDVVEGLYVDIERIWTKIEEGELSDAQEISRLLRMALDNTEQNIVDAH